jgi:puromycin-sensitive aminopeptidase
MTKIHAKLGWDSIPGESHLDTLLRSLVLNRLASLRDEGIGAEAKKRFASHCNESALLPPDLRGPVYRAVAALSDPGDFEALFQLYRKSDQQEEKVRISSALGAVREQAQLEKVLTFSLSDEVRSQDAVFVITSVASSSGGRDLAWDFFQRNHAELRRRYEGSLLVSRLVKQVTENFCSEEKIPEIRAFFEQNPFSGSERSLGQALESILLNSKWLTRDEDVVHKYFAQKSLA